MGWSLQFGYTGVMSQIDRVKEKIGWYKVLFGVLIAAALSLLAWLVNNLVTVPTWQLLCGVAGAVVVCAGIIAVHFYALKLIDSLGDL
jgi:NO-binding membrane sensor protein with MHYT domain